MTMRSRRAWARWLIALLLLPIVLGVIPAVPLSAEQALARDLGLSICTPNGAQDQGRAPASHDQQCVLCTVGCATCAPGVPGNAGATLLPNQPASAVVFVATAISPPDLLLWRFGSPPRGPPTSLIV
ncbi:MAG: hypothetical protein U1E67_02730 [Hyphomicrobiales bacterium]